MSELPPVPIPDESTSSEHDPETAIILVRPAGGGEARQVEATAEEIDAIAEEVNRGASY